MESLSEHAVIRMQQRGIPHAALECLLEYGRVQHDRHGGAIVFFDKAARRRLSRAVQEQAVFPATVSMPRKALIRGREPPGFRITVRNDERYVKHGDWAKIYAVIATDGTITTVGHRYKRIPRL